jgi:hypothetical protein
MQRHAIQKIAGAGQGNQSIEQTDPIKTQRDSKPKD